MHKKNDNWIFSPSDLTTFWESEFAAWVDRYTKENPNSGITQDPDDGMKGVLQKKGLRHEEAINARFTQNGLKVKEICKAEPDAAFEQTQAAMEQGFDVIYQAYLRKGNVAGFADFLVKVPGKSKFGDYHYEAWDTKLASKLKPYFIIQLCAYSDMLEEIQGVKPGDFVVVLGNRQEKRLKFAHFEYYYRAIMERFLRFHATFDSKHRPEPEKYRSFGKWSNYAEALMKETDSLWQVANMGINQIKNLKRAGVTTMTQLASLPDMSIPKMGEATFRKLRKQAQMQLKTIDGKPSFEVRDDMEEGKGLCLLPASSQNDVFFDMEGYPVTDGGLEYLWGNTYLEDGKKLFKDFWAHDPHQEKLALENFVDWILARWKRDPTMHVYHYAEYEITALNRLTGRYETREEEVAMLLKAGVFVDLYAVVRQGLWIGAPSYSIKQVELIYRGKRSGAVTDGGASIEAYQDWLDAPDGDTWENSEKLNNLREYNKDDCESTYDLAVWLRNIQKEAQIAPYVPGPIKEDKKKAQNDGVDEGALKRALADAGESQPEAELLSQLLGFHKREDRPAWAEYFRRLRMTEAELRDDEGCLAALRRTKLPEKPIRSSKLLFFSYNPSQDTKLSVGDKCVLHAEPDGKMVEVHELDTTRGFVSLIVSKDRTLPDRISLVPVANSISQSLRKGVVAFCQAWVEGGENGKAVTRFLRSEKPKIAGHTGGPLVSEGSDSVDKIIDLVQRMDETTLCIQGPPGAGKTFTGEHLIAALVKVGKKVGIVSNSHKAINNLLIKAAAACVKGNIPCKAYKVRGEEERDIAASGSISRVESGSDVPYDDGVDLVGGTAWAFVHPNARGQYDYLFIDEAGQVSLANFVAMGICTKNIVLLGDQMQLSQTIRGSHPGKTGLSCLSFLLGDHSTIPPDIGLFLGVTRRMHPDVCRLVSDMSYDGRLQAAPETVNRVVKFAPGRKGIVNKEAGLVFVPVIHEGNSRASDEEVDCIVKLVEELKGRKLTDLAGKEVKTIDLSDILFVTPYNLQVRKLKERLGEEAKVGSVDRFQGQEAPIVILSMCSSALSGGGGRGVDFLFSKNRLNVAISRAQCLTIVVGHPDLGATYCGNDKDMYLVNLFCQLMAYAKI